MKAKKKDYKLGQEKQGDSLIPGYRGNPVCRIRQLYIIFVKEAPGNFSGASVIL